MKITKNTKNLKSQPISKIEYKQVKQQLDQNQSGQIKMQKIKKQINILNLGINFLLKQQKIKDNFHKVLSTERKKLQNCFLLKNEIKYKQSEKKTQINQDQLKDSKVQVKNRFHDVNQRIIQYSKLLQTYLKQKSIDNASKNNQQLFKKEYNFEQKMTCQSSHLKQIFNPQNQTSHIQKVNKLKLKLNLLYDKIKLNLQNEEPYLYEKILQRIKRQTHKQVKLKILTEIQALTKQNSKWINQQSNKVNNQLEEKSIEQMGINNLGLMKKIMSKKVFNNDFIFENYENKQQNQSQYSKQIKDRISNSLKHKFPINKIQNQYKTIQNKIQENKILIQLQIVNDNSFGRQQENILSNFFIRNLLSDPLLNQFIFSENNIQNSLALSQQDLMSQCTYISNKIQQLSKK